MKTLQQSLDAANEELEKIQTSLIGKTDAIQSELDLKKNELTPFNDQLNEIRGCISLKEGELELLQLKTTENERGLEFVLNEYSNSKDAAKSMVY